MPYDLIDEINYVSGLSGDLREISGAQIIEGDLWGLNDSGDAPRLYRIQTETGDVLSSVLLNDTENTDWEDMTTDSSFIYLGDFGNNRGNREDLRIIRLNKSALTQETANDYGVIRYAYTDQGNTFFEKEMHDFNCEAMIAVEDSLYIFTKNHISLNTRCYALPKSPGEYSVAPRSTFDVKGLVTAADFDEENQVLILLGYESGLGGYTNFISVFWDFPGTSFFAGKYKRFNLDINEQAESLCFTEPGVIYIASEREMLHGGNLYQIDLRQKTEAYQ